MSNQQERFTYDELERGVLMGVGKYNASKKPHHIPLELSSDQLAIVGNSHNHHHHHNSNRHTTFPSLNGSDECNNKQPLLHKHGNNGGGGRSGNHNNSRSAGNNGKLKERTNAGSSITKGGRGNKGFMLSMSASTARDFSPIPPAPQEYYKKSSQMKI